MQQVKGAQYQNSEILQGSIIGNIQSFIDTSLAASTDPFASKTNKYAESDTVEITAIDKPIWVLFSSAGTAAQKNVDNNYYIEAGKSKIFAIEEGKRFLRIIEDAASARSQVTELK